MEDEKPVSDKFEGIILGTAMHYPQVIDEFSDLKESHFRSVENGYLWSLMQTMRNNNRPIAPLTVLSETEKGSEYPNIHSGFLGILTSIAQNGLDIVELEYYKTEVINRHRLGALRAAGAKITQVATASSDADYATAEAWAALDSVSDATLNSHAVTFADATEDLIQSYRAPSNVIPTPWMDLNALARGWRAGALHVWGARPGIGKTVAGLQSAIALAELGKGRVLFLSLEMSPRELAARALSQMSGVPHKALETRNTTQAHAEALRAATARMKALGMVVLDSRTNSITKLAAEARSLHTQEPLAAVVVDYIQLMGAGTPIPGNKNAEVSEITRGLKLLAGQLNVPVIALSQLSRAGAGRSDTMPQLTDLRDSGSIEQDADTVFLMHRETNPEKGDVSALTINVAKNRHGSNGMVDLTFAGHVYEIRN